MTTKAIVVQTAGAQVVTKFSRMDKGPTSVWEAPTRCSSPARTGKPPWRRSGSWSRTTIGPPAVLPRRRTTPPTRSGSSLVRRATTGSISDDELPGRRKREHPGDTERVGWAVSGLPARRRRIAEIRKKTPPSVAYPARLVSEAFGPAAIAMKLAPARVEIPPLRISARWPPSRRRWTATTSCTMPAAIAQAPHTRRALGTPDEAATARPTAVSRLSNMLRYSGRLAPEDRMSYAAAATSNRGRAAAGRR